MKIRIIIAFVLLNISYNVSYGQSENHNYVKSMTMLQAYSYDDDIDPGIDENLNTRTTIQYYDGLGRPIQTAQNGLNQSGKYVNTYNVYDINGNLAEQWSPIPGSTQPDFIERSAFNQLSSDFYKDNNAHTFNTYDVMQRPISKMMAGMPWHSADKKKIIRYITNQANSVKWYDAPLSKDGLQDLGYYGAGTLTGEEVIDEDGHKTVTYKNLFGNTVLERRNGNNDTYYVYNLAGQLRYVLTPNYQSDKNINTNAYEYQYDSHGNIIRRILPACAFEQYWYDNNDYPTFYQDGTLRDAGKYRFMLYDKFGRKVVQGICDKFDKDKMNHDVPLSSGGGICGTGYMLQYSTSINNPVIESVDYYDNYDFLNIYSKEFAEINREISDSDLIVARSMKTGQLRIASDGSRFFDAYFYDYKGNIIEQYSYTPKYGLITTNNDYTFTNQLLKSEENIPAQNITRILTNNYSDKTGLLLSEDLEIKIGNTYKKQRIKEIEYNDLGQIKSVKRGQLLAQSEDNMNPSQSSSTGIDAVNYAYNVNGWLNKISSNDFTEELHYTDGVGTPCFNGNISSQLWIASGDKQKRGYKFAYDGLDRLTSAEYGEQDGLNTNANCYDEKILKYDDNSRIMRLQRRGMKDIGKFGEVDDLQLNYSAGHLAAVSDKADAVNKYAQMEFKDGSNDAQEYKYNNVGCLIRDTNKGINNIIYDYLNHPKRIEFKNGNNIEYVYNADGSKIMTKSSGKTSLVGANEQDETNYLNDFIFSKNDTKCVFDGGYASINGANVAFHYYTKDHLGNNRIVKNEKGQVEQVNHYYPFGGVITNISTNPFLQKYKYNGKELDRTHGLDWYDYGARMYDPVLAMWTSVDPLAEKYRNLDSYLYCANNPVNAIDPDGRDIHIIYKDNKNQYQEYIFKGYRGKKSIAYPSNNFVRDFINAYNYNTKNGGGKKMMLAATNSKYDIYLYDGNDKAIDYTPDTEYYSQNGKKIIRWESRTGIYVEDGSQSPATRLEHEFDHAVDDSNNHSIHNDRARQYDEQYGNKEERRVIIGDEKDTAIKNGETVRKSHSGIPFKTRSSISNAPII
ncbi:MAG: RHS repeat-associated core domain-containing protein [Prevotella sp.]|nr:RHS repeat-associated core domain-containing protein [Prevotella sp.]